MNAPRKGVRFARPADDRLDTLPKRDAASKATQQANYLSMHAHFTCTEGSGIADEFASAVEGDLVGDIDDLVAFVEGSHLGGPRCL